MPCLVYQVDHIIAKQHLDEVSDDPETLSWACSECNAAKWIHTSATDSETDEVVRLFNPRRSKWHDNFLWSANSATALEPTTPEARVTIELLALNSPHRRQVRQWLTVLGLHRSSFSFVGGTTLVWN